MNSIKNLQIVSEPVPVTFLDVLTHVPVTENVSMDVHALSKQIIATSKISHQIMVTSPQMVTTTHATSVTTVKEGQVLINSTYSAPFYTYPFLFYLTSTFKKCKNSKSVNKSHIHVTRDFLKQSAACKCCLRSIWTFTGQIGDSRTATSGDRIGPSFQFFGPDKTPVPDLSNISRLEISVPVRFLAVLVWSVGPWAQSYGIC